MQLSVNRCGMIYMEPQQLGWSPLKDSYMNTLPENLDAEHKQLVSLHKNIFYLANYTVHTWCLCCAFFLYF